MSDIDNKPKPSQDDGEVTPEDTATLVIEETDSDADGETETTPATDAATPVDEDAPMLVETDSITFDTVPPVEDIVPKVPIVKIPLSVGQQIAKTAVILFAITAISAFALGLTNTLTADSIAAHIRAAVDTALIEVLPAADSFTEQTSEAEGVDGFYVGMKDGAVVGYGVQVAPAGYGGPITMIVGVNADGTAAGVSIVKMSETPGLGTKCTTPEFLGRFVGKTAGLVSGKGGNAVDTVTGATVTSNAMTNGVATALAGAADYAMKGATP